MLAEQLAPPRLLHERLELLPRRSQAHLVSPSGLARPVRELFVARLLLVGPVALGLEHAGPRAPRCRSAGLLNLPLRLPPLHRHAAAPNSPLHVSLGRDRRATRALARLGHALLLDVVLVQHALPLERLARRLQRLPQLLQALVNLGLRDHLGHAVHFRPGSPLGLDQSFVVAVAGGLAAVQPCKDRRLAVGSNGLHPVCCLDALSEVRNLLRAAAGRANHLALLDGDADCIAASGVGSKRRQDVLGLLERPFGLRCSPLLPAHKARHRKRERDGAVRDAQNPHLLRHHPAHDLLRLAKALVLGKEDGEVELRRVPVHGLHALPGSLLGPALGSLASCAALCQRSLAKLLLALGVAVGAHAVGVQAGSLKHAVRRRGAGCCGLGLAVPAHRVQKALAGAAAMRLLLPVRADER